MLQQPIRRGKSYSVESGLRSKMSSAIKVSMRMFIAEYSHLPAFIHHEYNVCHPILKLIPSNRE